MSSQLSVSRGDPAAAHTKHTGTFTFCRLVDRADASTYIESREEKETLLDHTTESACIYRKEIRGKPTDATHRMPMIEEIVDEPPARPSPAAAAAEEEEPLNVNVSGVPDPDENYHDKTEQRIKKEWEEQLELAKGANANVDQEDVDARDLYGEQSVHNYPDVHADWGDDAGVRAAAARSARAAGMFPNHLTSGWNTEYRQQLEDALAMVADSRDVMKNLKKMRVRRDDQKEGLEPEQRGRTAEEDAAEWEAKRAEDKERAARRRKAEAAAAAAAAEAEEKENASRVVGKALPEFMMRRRHRDGHHDGSRSNNGENMMNNTSGSAADDHDLVAAHREWLNMLGADERELDDARRRRGVRDASLDSSTSPLTATVETEETEESAEGGVGGGDSGASAVAEDLASIRRTMAAAAAAVRNDDDDEDDDDDDFFSRLSSVRPTGGSGGGGGVTGVVVGGGGGAGEPMIDFWNQEVYGVDDVDDELDNFEEQMARLCAAEIDAARRSGRPEVEE